MTPLLCRIYQGARVYAAVVESEAVRSRSRLLPGNPAGLSTSSVRPTNEEPYTCEVSVEATVTLP